MLNNLKEIPNLKLILKGEIKPSIMSSDDTESIASLPFAAANWRHEEKNKIPKERKEKLWSVKPTGDYGIDCLIGEKWGYYRTEVRLHYGNNMMVVSELSTDIIYKCINQLDNDGVLLDHTIAI